MASGHQEALWLIKMLKPPPLPVGICRDEPDLDLLHIRTQIKELRRE